MASAEKSSPKQQPAQMAELHRLARAMCSIDLAESQWTQELPRLPVPDLWLTVSRYLASLKAVLAPLDQLVPRDQLEGCQLSDEQLRARWNQFENTDQLVKQFMLVEGPELQRDLKEYANKGQNWATEFWLQDMYLCNKLPLPVNSNPFFLFPRQSFGSSHEMLMFATRIIQFSVDFKYRIDQQSLKQDYGSGHGKGKALCMETYKNFFHSYRMPHEQMDRLLPQSRRSNHIVVASCNQFFVLRLGQEPLDNPYRREPANQLEETSVFEQLLRIYRVSREQARRQQQRPSSAAAAGGLPKVGLLTSERRNVWARWHKRLGHCSHSTMSAARAGRLSGDLSAPANGKSPRSSLAGSPNTNTESLRQIEDCLFVMCLDSLVDQHQQQSDELDDTHAAKLILTGGGSQLFTANRWFDKFLQIIVGRNGVCGINIEHSASEGITVLRFLEEFLQFIRSNPIRANHQQHSNQLHMDEQQQQQQQPSLSSPSYVEPKSPSALLEESDKITRLEWQLDQELESAIEQAESRANSLVDNFSLVILQFQHFGRELIKRQNLSPDAFVQLALQFTFFKLHGQLVSTYESASLRQFRLGRVDNIRANTCEAYAWIQAMLGCKRQASGSVCYQAAQQPFIRAITKQVEILRYTIVGGAPDNHLLALRELAKIRYGPDELPELFADESYKEFLNFRLSTSQLPNESGITVGYGAVVPDGYGCSYNPCEQKIVFCISSFRDCPVTSSSKFAQKLEESLLEMRQLCEQRTASGRTGPS